MKNNIKIQNLLFTLLFFFSKQTIAQTPQWEFMGLAGASIADIAVDDSNNIYVASWTGVYKSTNHGTSWVFKNNGLEIAEAIKIFIDHEGNIYLGAEGYSNTGCGLYKSTNTGETWIKIADTLNNKPNNIFYDVTIIPNEPGGIIYVSNYYGIHRSTNNGQIWESTNFTHYGSIDIGINTNGYMFFGNDMLSWFGIYRSTDLGLNWERQAFLGVRSMVYLRDGSILAGCYDPGLGNSGIYKTTTNGNFWFNTNTFSGLIWFPDFVLDNNDDIYTSVDHVFLSTNNGISWLNYGLPGQGAFKLAIDPSGYIWSGNHLDGVYRTAGRTVPVQLVSFTADVNNYNVLLSWITASEINNRGFEIERSEIREARNRNTNEGWEKIGFVGGNGTTAEMNYYSFMDKYPTDGTYNYRLKQIDYDGSYEYSNLIKVEVGTPTDFYLSQNYPNPFNLETNIDYRIPEETFINISLYNATGRKIKEFVNEKKHPGYYTLKLKGGELCAGIYFYRMSTSSGYTAVNKITIIK